MALIIRTTHGIDLDALDTDERLWVYNAMDVCVTHTVHNVLAEKLRQQNTPHARISYNFVRAMQGPALDMMRRGVMIQQEVRQDETDRYTRVKANSQSLLDKLADAVWGPETYVVRNKLETWETPIGKRGQPLKSRRKVLVTESYAQRPRGLNAQSDKQIIPFFTIALGLPPQYEIRKRPEGNIRTPSANAKALRKWADMRVKGPGVNIRDRSYDYIRLAQPFVNLILTCREADKMLSVLKTPGDSDGRMRCSYNVVGTENGRWSSSENAFGRGTNLQNITPTMRRMFCADDGYVFVSTDLEQAESRLVAALVWSATGDDTYWRACESSDLHTTVCRMTWPELPWTGEPKNDRAIADRPYPALPKFSYRDVAKRLGHGSNYRGSAIGIAQAVGIPTQIVSDFQARYFAAFPAIPRWHEVQQQLLREHHYLDTPLIRRRYFFGRAWDDKTVREAIAFSPQSTIGELLNLALWRVWARTLPDPQRNTLYPNTSRLPLQLLLQNHDAFAFQVPITANLPSVLAEVKRELEIPIPITRGNETRHLVIPGEFVTGYNWAYADDTTKPQDTWHFRDGNPDGLRKWRGAELRKRQQSARPTTTDWLNRPLHGVHA